MSEEKLGFQADVSRVLDIVANSLYSNKEIFLRELISNASDACDRLRYATLTKPELSAEDPDFKIVLSVDKKARSLSVSDNGIGMNRDDMIANLGTIARSGTSAFVEHLEKAKEDVNLIGQFGVGFYSAFMVAGHVEVTSRKAGENQGWRWVSDGKGEFTVSTADDAPRRGTEVVVYFTKGEQDFLDVSRLRQIVRKYSDHIAIPVLLETGVKDEGDAEALNSASAIWTRPKSEISDEQYKEFYSHIGHGFDEPWMRVHFKAEGVLEYTALVFVPSTRPYDLLDPVRRHKVKLYVKRVFITDQCDELLPSYLRFLCGVIDSEDLPLNISRETLQHNVLMSKIRARVVKRVLSELKKKAEKAPEDYVIFWENFGSVLKEGLYEASEKRAELLPLVRFRSTTRDGWVSLADYVGRMKEGQEAIYYLTGKKLESLRKSPQLEGFAAKGVEVLLLTDPVDDFWLPAVGEYEDKPLKSVAQGNPDLGQIEAVDTPDEKNGAEAEQAKSPELDTLITSVRASLEGKVKDVQWSERLTQSPVCLVADETGMDLQLERLLQQQGQFDIASRRILEVNPNHQLIRRLAERIAGNGTGQEQEAIAQLLLDQARILEGQMPPDPVAFVQRLSDIVVGDLAH